MSWKGHSIRLFYKLVSPINPGKVKKCLKLFGLKYHYNLSGNIYTDSNEIRIAFISHDTIRFSTKLYDLHGIEPVNINNAPLLRETIKEYLVFKGLNEYSLETMRLRFKRILEDTWFPLNLRSIEIFDAILERLHEIIAPDLTRLDYDFSIDTKQDSIDIDIFDASRTLSVSTKRSGISSAYAFVNFSDRYYTMSNEENLDTSKESLKIFYDFFNNPDDYAQTK